jgi:hypothetical protein
MNRHDRRAATASGRNGDLGTSQAAEVEIVELNREGLSTVEHDTSATPDQGGNGFAGPEVVAADTAAVALSSGQERSILTDIIDTANIDDRPSVFTDLESIMLTDAEDGVDEEQFTSDVIFGKPNNQSYVRCHPDPDRVTRVFGIKDKNSLGRIFIVPKPLLPKLGPLCQRYILRQAITSAGVSSIWPAPLPSGKKDNPSGASHLGIQQRALREWVRLYWDDNHSTFHGALPLADLGEPQWPDKTFKELLSIAVTGYVVDSEEHHLFRRLVYGR